MLEMYILTQEMIGIAFKVKITLKSHYSTIPVKAYESLFSSDIPAYWREQHNTLFDKTMLPSE